ncbi:uncharacterized protein LOC128736503 [Sabethes cyaneus]|uniref:uncharacterized protein LOC128736503 n=1 Tax=Sabethes cyaneus TaxID=53552 RepID=UPI00237EBA6D|nr:uncharacterized protein LOC128736503 [Sabethes cyaneus]
MTHNLLLLPCYLLLVNGLFGYRISVLGLSGGADEYGYIAPLFDYDNYNACRHQQPALYCLAKVVIEPVRNSDNSTRIIAGPRKNVLERGVCVAQCAVEIGQLNATEHHRLLQPKIDVPYMYTMSIFWKETIEQYINRYGELVNICINNRLEQKHNIVAYSELEYCLDVKSAGKIELDWLKITFAAVLLSFLVTFLIANVIDLLGNDRLKNQTIVTSFSVRRNVALLLQEPKTELTRDFAYIDGLRVLICSSVLLSHCLLSAKFTPISNPETFVQIYYNPITLGIVTPLAMLVKMFFTISGLLLTVHVLKDFRTKPQAVGWYYFTTKFAHRLIRLLPVYYFFLLHATVYDWYPGIDTGIIGYKTMTMERLLCRKYWWSNVLFLNNLPLVVGQCFGHTWYLSSIRRFLGSRPMAAVGKLSYCAYMLHPTLMRIFSLSPMMPDLPVEFTVGSLFSTWLCVTVGSYLFGAIVYLCLEQPMSLLLRRLYGEYSREKKKI